MEELDEEDASPRAKFNINDALNTSTFSSQEYTYRV